MIAGAGLNDRRIVEFVVEGAPRAIQRLVALGVPINTEGKTLHLTPEGGHRHRRIVHVKDATGRAVPEPPQLAAHAHPNPTMSPHTVVDHIATTTYRKTQGSD